MAIITDDMISERITRKDLLPLSFLKKSAYTGSKRSFNYKLEKTEIELPNEEAEVSADTNETTAAESKPETESGKEPVMKTVLRVYWWLGWMSYDATPAEAITSYDAEFSDAGIEDAISYLNDMMSKKADL